MPLDFPANPSVNDTYSFGGKTWIWNGEYWRLQSAGAINDIPIGNVTANTGNFTTLTVETGVSSNLSPTANVTFDLGNTTNRWNDLWLANSTIYIGNGQISANATSLTLTNPDGSAFDPVGNIDATSIQNGTSNVTVISSGGNVDVNVGGSAIVTFYSNGINNRQANGVGNIGTASSYFNTVFAKATSAQYADVAERYVADADYVTGTVLVFGGDQEVTQSQIGHTTKIAGTVSDKPAYVMNTGLTGDHVVTVALLGRVPVRVIGIIRPGDLLVASELPGVATSMIKERYEPGCVIGKALESYDSQREGVIEVVVGRL